MKQTEKYYCEECGKYLFDTDKPRGAAGFLAIDLGFVYKMPILFGISGSHFFCCKECWNKWLAEHTTPEKREEGDKAVADIRKRMAARQPELWRGLQRIQDTLEKKRKQ